MIITDAQAFNTVDRLLDTLYKLKLISFKTNDEINDFQLDSLVGYKRTGFDGLLSRNP